MEHIMTTIRTGYSLFDRYGLNNAASRDLSLYVEDKKGNRINLSKPSLESKRDQDNTPRVGNPNIGNAIDDLMRNVFGLPADSKSKDDLGDTKLEYTGPDGTKVSLNIDRPDKPKVDDKKDNDGCCNANNDKDALSDFADTMTDEIDDAVTKMMKDMGFDTEDANQSAFERKLESRLEDQLEDMLVDSMYDSVMDSLFGDYGNDSFDNSDFSPWSPWGNTLFSPYNPYLSARTFPASYAYAQMVGEWMLSNQRPVYNPNLTNGGFALSPH
jgi:hypothetical protein